MTKPGGRGTMDIDERQRHRLHERLDEVLGTEEAAILMGHLPPIGWADVATKDHLDGAVAQLRSEVSASESRLRAEVHQALSAIRGDMMSNQRQTIFAIVASQFTAVSLALAAFSMAQ